MENYLTKLIILYSGFILAIIINMIIKSFNKRLSPWDDYQNPKLEKINKFVTIALIILTIIIVVIVN